jgi:homoserine/homoserine lactone efflux protein
MDRYPLFVAVATLAILSPGPGVVMTLTNAVRGGLRGAIGGILGIACGAWVVAAASATGLGLLLAASGTAFTIVKWLGAAYLVYLGVRLWRAPPMVPALAGTGPIAMGQRFKEGLSLQLTNPKAVAFFLSVLPQFLQPAHAGAGWFALLVMTYAVLIVLIHSGYALAAQQAQRWLRSPRGGRLLQRAGALTFIFFGAALAASKR